VATTPFEAAVRPTPLTRERVLRAAVDLADQSGLESLSMRRLGQELGVDPMALYRHIRSKEDLLDGIVDLLVGEVERPPPGGDWSASLRGQAMAARRVMLKHPWARRVVEERSTTGLAVLTHVESVLATLLDAGFSMEVAHHALHVLGSRIFGFSQDMLEDSARSAPSAEAAAMLAAAMQAFPRISELAQSVSHEGALGPCDDDVEFAFGLDLILDGLARQLGSASR
jgi:AcrR family transcriptional regulator